MAPRKTERILNLTICLLVSGRFVPKSRIREAVEGYHDLSDAAFERTFERDKDELRALGVPIEVGSFDPLFDDEPGLSDPAVGVRAAGDRPGSRGSRRGRCRRPGLAAREHGRVDAECAGEAACRRDRAGHLPAGRSCSRPSRPPSLAFEPLWNAVITRTRVSFTYRDGAVRTVEPWGMTSRKGRWYVIGWDLDRLAERMFKVSRISDRPKRVSRAGAYQVPANRRSAQAGTIARPAGADRDRGPRDPRGQGAEPAPSRRTAARESRAAGRLRGVRRCGFSDVYPARRRSPTCRGRRRAEPPELREAVVAA